MKYLVIKIGLDAHWGPAKPTVCGTVAEVAAALGNLYTMGHSDDWCVYEFVGGLDGKLERRSIRFDYDKKEYFIE